MTNNPNNAEDPVVDEIRDELEHELLRAGRAYSRPGLRSYLRARVPHRVRRVLAIGLAVAIVPGGYAVASGTGVIGGEDEVVTGDEAVPAPPPAGLSDEEAREKEAEIEAREAEGARK